MVRMGRCQAKRLERTGKIEEGNAFIRRDRDANGPGQGHRLAPWQNLADLGLSAVPGQINRSRIPVWSDRGSPEHHPFITVGLLWIGAFIRACSMLFDPRF